MPAVLRRTVVLGLLLAGALTLAACGGSDGDSSTATSSAAADTQAATTADSGSFCDDFAGVADDIVVNLDEGDPSTFSDKFTTAADALKSVQPPAAIADDWSTLTTFYEQFAAAFGEDEDKIGDALVQLQQNAGDLASASTNIAQYASKNC